MRDTPHLHRHSQDPNLCIYYGYEHEGMPLIWQQGPFIYNYLQRIDQTLQGALQDHSHIMAVRVDLRLPAQFSTMSETFNRPVFSRFIASLKAKIETRQSETIRNEKRFHTTQLHYIWTREFGQHGHPHYHCVLLFNKQTFRGLGEFDPHAKSLYGMISSAWASALGMDKDLADGLVSIPNNSVYHIKRDEQYDELFYRLSYFAKLNTKQFGRASHNFGTSRTHYDGINTSSP